MVKGDKVRLNHELLIWRGFTFSNGVWSYPDGSTVDGNTPFFPESMDECIEWLVPEFERIDLWQPLDKSYRWEIVRKRDNLYSSYFGGDKNLVLAFCLAVKESINAKE